MPKGRGFTIIELVTVIVILGILAAVALPKFFDITADAANAAAKGVAGAVASGSVINYGARLAKGAGVCAAGGTPCLKTAASAEWCTSAVLGLVLTGGATQLASVTVGGSFQPATTGVTGTCTFTSTSGGAAQSATIVGVVD